jgi:hypothetical protein
LFSSLQKEMGETQTFLFSILKECVLNLGIDYHKIKYVRNFEWAKTTTTILQDKRESNFAKFLIKSLIDSITWHNTYHLDSYIQQICEALVQIHFKSIWTDLSQALLADKENYVKYCGLKHIFGSQIGGVGRDIGILFIGNNIDEIFEWCHNNKPLASKRLAGLVPIYSNNNHDYSQWNPISKQLIDEFGDDKEMLNELDSNIGSFSWTGSLVPLLQAKIKLFESLVNHPIVNVKDWANKNLQYIDKEIKNEINRDAEMFL